MYIAHMVHTCYKVVPSKMPSFAIIGLGKQRHMPKVFSHMVSMATLSGSRNLMSQLSYTKGILCVEGTEFIEPTKFQNIVTEGFREVDFFKIGQSEA